MSIQTNTFCWQSIATDLGKNQAFYTNVLGWTVKSDGQGPPLAVGPGGEVAHFQAPEMGPPAWCSFVAVDDLDLRTAAAATHGSATLVPPTDLPVGRFSIVTTPSGAVLGLYQAAEQDVQAKRGPGSIHWVELQSTAPEGDLAWFSAVFGFTPKTQTMQSGPYHLLTIDGVPQGGVTTSNVDASMFVAWMHVADLDEAIANVKTYGGTLRMEPVHDPDVGRMVMVSDPSGATFGLVQPSGRDA